MRTRGATAAAAAFDVETIVDADAIAYLQQQTDAARAALDMVSVNLGRARMAMTQAANKGGEQGERLDARDWQRVWNVQHAALEIGVKRFEVAAAALKAATPYARKALRVVKAGRR